jgi:hypothetical protein
LRLRRLLLLLLRRAVFFVFVMLLLARRLRLDFTAVRRMLPPPAPACLFLRVLLDWALAALFFACLKASAGDSTNHGSRRLSKSEEAKLRGFCSFTFRANALYAFASFHNSISLLVWLIWLIWLIYIDDGRSWARQIFDSGQTRCSRCRL